MRARRCPARRLTVPDEVAVLGVDDDEPICELADPPLSSVRPDYAQAGYRAAELLDGLMRGAKPSAQDDPCIARGNRRARNRPIWRPSRKRTWCGRCDLSANMLATGIRVEQVASEATFPAARSNDDFRRP